jgi:hypothetical protein
VIVKVLKWFSGVWLLLFLVSIPMSTLGILLKAPTVTDGIKQLISIWSPANSSNYLVVFIVMSPSVGAFYLAEYLNRKKQESTYNKTF